MIVERERTYVEKPANSPSAFRVSTAAVLIFAALYGFFFFLHLAFPYVQSGADLVANYKHNLARHGQPFQSPRGLATGNPGTGKLHVMTFGYSKMLAGMIPSQFEADMKVLGYPAVEAYNFGLPGDSRFVADLEAMAARDRAPDIALLTFPWPESDPDRPSFFHFLNDDQEVMNTLFPFRTLPRDALIMLDEGGGFSGMRRVYLQSEAAVKQVIADRGYYFMVRQSHYPHDQLPDGYRTPMDTPKVVKARQVPWGPIYSELAPILAQRHIQCILVPDYFRQREFAVPPPMNESAAHTVSTMPNVALEGPDYWLYPNAYFSDAAHLNPRGALVYTQQLAELLANWLKTHRPQ